MPRLQHTVDDRFEFGANWARFLAVLDEKRIRAAEASLKEMLGIETLRGRSFLDVGSGSGLFSLAARRLGARVHSFDVDAQSVACTRELKRRYFPDDDRWRIEEGSVLDRGYLGTLGTFDVVYSWGVLHHTGAMWVGIENLIGLVSEKGGRLYIAVYNDQGWKSRVWWLVKRIYNGLPRPLNRLYGYSLGFLTHFFVLVKYSLRLQPMAAIRPWLRYKERRGMSLLHDMIDWIGGFPFEFAAYEVLEAYFDARGFELVNGRRSSGSGCHEMVFARRPPAS